MCPIYKEIGDHFGSIDLSFLPIWRGGSLGFVSYAGLSIDLEAFFIASHSTPACAVGMHKDLRSKVSIPIHFATFVGCEDETLETTSELAHACEQAGVPTDLQDTNATNTFACLDIGQQVAIPCTSRTIM